MTKFYVSQSKVNAWLTCRMKYILQYEDHLARKKKPRPLQFGSIVHNVIEVAAEKNEKAAELKLREIDKENARLFDEEREMYGDIIEDIRYIMNAYFDYWRKDPLVYVTFKGKKTEHPIEVPLTNDGIFFKGTLDAIAKNKGLKWLVEHKSHGQFPNDDHRWRNLQTSIYLPMAELAGVDGLDGVVWDYIRSKPPTRPQILKSGELSERKLDSLPQVVIDTIKQNKLPVDAYRLLIADQKANLSSWFQRVYTPIKSSVIKKVKADFITTAKEMAQGDWAPVRTIGKHCDWCQFEPLCRAHLQGNDVEFVKKTEYEIEEDRYDRKEVE